MHSHPMAIVLLVISAGIVGNFFVDTIMAGLFPNSPAVRGLKQAQTGA